MRETAPPNSISTTSAKIHDKLQNGGTEERYELLDPWWIFADPLEEGEGGEWDTAVSRMR